MKEIGGGGVVRFLIGLVLTEKVDIKHTSKFVKNTPLRVLFSTLFS